MSEVLDPPMAHPTQQALARLDAAAGEVAGADLWALSDRELLALRTALERVAGRLAAARLAATGEISARGATTTLAAVSTTAWLTEALRLHPGAAAREVRLAAALRTDLPATSGALGEGAIGVDAAEVIADTDRALSKVATAAQRTDAEALLAEHAGMLSVRGLQAAALHLRHRLDPAAGDHLAADEQAQHAERELQITLQADGSCRGRFVLDTEATAALRTALDPLTAPRPANQHGAGKDPRSAPRRRADALIELAEHALRCGGPPEGGGSPTQLTVTVPLDTLRRQAGAAAAEVDLGLPLSAEATRRLACDAQVLPVVLGGAGQPLDIGRAARTVPTPMRRALVVRDRGCAFPGCERPPAWTHAHHIRHWSDGGTTDLANLVLLCGRHHRVIHHTGWAVHIAPDGLPEFHPPPWVDPHQAPRRHIRHSHPAHQPDDHLPPGQP